MMRRLWPLALLAPGAVLLILQQFQVIPASQIYLRAGLGPLLLVTGGLLALALVIFLELRARAARDWRRILAAQQTHAAEVHGRFLRRLDHEMKNPITAIRAGLGNLPVEQEDEPVVAGVRAHVDRLARLSGDLRKLAELETQPIEQEAVHLDELLDDLVEIARQRDDGAARNLKLVLPSAPWPLPPVTGDGDLLYLVLHNLVDNAIKFSRPGDTVEIRASEDGASVALEVADTGPGIPEEELRHVGEELYRGTLAREANVPGSGLGLSLCNAIIARHGGMLAVRSRLGSGTVVSVRLPLPRVARPAAPSQDLA